jgi:hypothetical protein
MIKVKNIFDYKPSYEEKKYAYIVFLTKEYEPIFLKTINKEKLTLEEQKKLLEGINKVEGYILKSIKFKIQEEYSLKNGLEKKLETLYKNLLKYEDHLNIDIQFKELIKEEIYKSLGFLSEDKSFIKKNKNSFFIKYIQVSVLYSIINYLEEKLEGIKLELNKEIEDDSNEEEVDYILEKSGLKKSLQEDILIELKNVLLRKEEVTKEIVPYLEFLGKKK